MNENCVTGKNGVYWREIYWLCVGRTEQVTVFLMATESRRTRGAATRGVAFCLQAPLL